MIKKKVVSSLWQLAQVTKISFEVEKQIALDK